MSETHIIDHVKVLVVAGGLLGVALIIALIWLYLRKDGDSN